MRPLRLAVAAGPKDTDVNMMARDLLPNFN
jgi:hypothetical protein